MARRANTSRVRKHETLEARVVMTASPLGGPMMQPHGFDHDLPPLTQHGPSPTQGFVESAPAHDPNADFWLGAGTSLDLLDDLDRQIEQNLRDGHSLTGQDDVVDRYGFKGTGQTVAVIDSGIAYSHTALGGGLGAGYRVVGGWDFTENDADPYDDGPSSSAAHGTHVAGIVGASGDGVHQGVASDVDLVGLRVFDDAGNGYFSWVEQALRWVHTNRNAFENPITAVNLSLGIEWNSDSIPSWANLEDEFAQLEADGIFISVSAGNSFTNYNQKGLSYPAGSSHVIPVMSVDNSGALSYFSQRSERAIAAPGRWITSTVPDYAANDGDTIDDDWLSMSGTSMAAPYVAGASVLIREAMEFVGQTDIDQWDIYNHMMSTADIFFDSATSTNFSRLNLEAAIDALMPEDDFGNSVETAHNLGVINVGLQSQSGPMSGHIANLGDSDYFTFTAGATGTVTFNTSSTTHAMDSAWQGLGGEGWTGDGGDSYTMNVVAGQQYTIALSSDDGLGYYDLSISAESTFTYTDWGALATQQSQVGLTAGAEAYYRVLAGQRGYVTAEALHTSGTVNLELLDANLNVLQSASAGRADYLAQAGEEIFIRVTGSASDLDIRLTNAVSLVDGLVTVVGTDTADAFAFSAGTTNTVSLNGVDYDFAAGAATQFNLVGGASDTVTLNGSAADEVFTLRQGDTQLSAVGVHVAATGFSTVTAYSGGGADTAYFHDTAGADNFAGLSDRAEMTGAGYSHVAHGFAQTHAYSTAGEDRAVLRDSDGDDTLHAYSDRSVLFGADFSNTAHGFGVVFAYATEGSDRALLQDSAGDDLVQTYGDRIQMRGDGFVNFAYDFDQRFAYSGSGSDRVIHYDTAGNDVYEAWSDRTVMRGDGFSNVAIGFATNEAYSTAGGADRSILHGTEGDDAFVAWSDRVTLSGDGYSNTATGFESNIAHGYGGVDRATLHDSPTDDLAFFWDSRVLLRSANFEHYATSFEIKYAMASSGSDRAIFMGSSGADLFRGWSHQAIMSGTGYLSYAGGFDSTVANASGSGDRAIFYDTAAAELFESSQASSRFNGSSFSHQANGFERVTALSTGGGDRAVLTDAAGDSTLTAAGADAVLSSDGYLAEAYGFEEVDAHNNGIGNDTADVSAVDYTLTLEGFWS